MAFGPPAYQFFFSFFRHASARRRALKRSCTFGGNVSTWRQAASPYEEYAAAPIFFQPQDGHEAATPLPLVFVC
jgi:hypothetical protein